MFALDTAKQANLLFLCNFPKLSRFTHISSYFDCLNPLEFVIKFRCFDDPSSFAQFLFPEVRLTLSNERDGRELKSLVSVRRCGHY